MKIKLPKGISLKVTEPKPLKIKLSGMDKSLRIKLGK